MEARIGMQRINPRIIAANVPSSRTLECLSRQGNSRSSSAGTEVSNDEGIKLRRQWPSTELQSRHTNLEDQATGHEQILGFRTTSCERRTLNLLKCM